MSKTIGLKQLFQKVYEVVKGLAIEFVNAIGEIEDCFDAIIYGPSGSGKTNFTIMLLKALLKAMPAAKAEYISYEEGHGKTVQDLMQRHNMLEEVGNRLRITEHLSAKDLIAKMSKKQSAKIWVIDSLQAAGFTYSECKELKEKMVLSRKKKIIIYVSWSEGKKPQGATACSVEYYANIKMRVQDLIMFPKSRYGGNHPFIIWPEGAKRRWGIAAYNKIIKSIPKPKTNDPENPVIPGSSDAAVMDSQ